MDLNESAFVLCHGLTWSDYLYEVHNGILRYSFNRLKMTDLYDERSIYG